MHKSYIHNLLIMTIATTLCLGASNAMALELSIYGVGHVSLDNNDDGTDSQLYVASNSSRLGFSGSHALDNGMDISFQYESGVDLTGRGNNDGNGPGTSDNLFSTARDSYVTLGGDFGRVLAGRLGVLNQWVYDFNLFADQVGDLGNIWGGTGLPGRANGVIAYSTPDFGDGFNGLLLYIPESGTPDADLILLKLNYGNSNDLKVGGAYTSVGQGTGNPEHIATAITISYGMGDLTLGGGYQAESDIAGVSGADRDSYTFGASFNIGNRGTIKAQYTSSSADAANEDANQVGVGYDYAVDKAATMYVAYSRTDNDPNTTFTANNYGHGQAVTPSAGTNPASISIGLVYKFDAGLIGQP